MTSSGRPLGWNEIEAHLVEVGIELERRCLTRSIIVVGGAYVAYHGARASTTDVDTIYELDDELRGAVATVAEQPTSVQGAWTAFDGVINYTVYRRLAGELVWTNVGMSATPAILLTGQPLGVELEFAVTATNEEGEGPRSVPDSITL